MWYPLARYFPLLFDPAIILSRRIALVQKQQIPGKIAPKNTPTVSQQGQFEDAFQHGRGCFKYSNGDLYNGQFSKGVREGKGKMQRASGVPHEWYEGDWLEDKPHGVGSLQSLNGFIEDGKFEQGEPVQAKS